MVEMMYETDYESFSYRRHRHSFGRYIYLVSLGALTAILNILLILLILVHRHRFWTSYRIYLLSMLISSACFAIIGFSLESNNTHVEITDLETTDTSLCKAWYVCCGSLLDGSLLSLCLVNIDRVTSILSPHSYTTKAYERGSKLALALTWVTVITVNLSFAFSSPQKSEFLPSQHCRHLMEHRSGILSVVWGSLHIISSVCLVIAIAYKTKVFPPNKIESKGTGCVIAILLLDFSIAFMGFAPQIARQIVPLYKTYNHQENIDLLYFVEWSTQILPPLFWLLDSNIRDSIQSICCCGRSCADICCCCCRRCCTKQRKSVDLVEASEKRGSKVTSGADM